MMTRYHCGSLTSGGATIADMFQAGMATQGTWRNVAKLQIPQYRSRFLAKRRVGADEAEGDRNQDCRCGDRGKCLRDCADERGFLRRRAAAGKGEGGEMCVWGASK